MPIFHFHLADHIREPDIEGTELPDVETARHEALVFAGAFLRDNPEVVRDGYPFSVKVTDESGTPLFTVEIKATDAV